MQDHIAHTRVYLMLLMCGLLAGCSSTSENLQFFADPGKYQYHTCEQIATARKVVAAREQALKGLIDKAEQGAAGVVVGAIAYRTDYVAANEELRVMEATARSKNCPAQAAPRGSTVAR